MTLVPRWRTLFAPWHSLYADSKTVASVVTGVHLVGLLFGGGLAVAADRSTLRALSGSVPSGRARWRSWTRCTGRCCWRSRCSS